MSCSTERLSSPADFSSSMYEDFVVDAVFDAELVALFVAPFAVTGACSCVKSSCSPSSAITGAGAALGCGDGWLSSAVALTGRDGVMTITASSGFRWVAAPDDSACQGAGTVALRPAPNSACPASSDAERHSMLAARLAPRIPPCDFAMPKIRATRATSGLRFAAMARAGADCHSAMLARARAYAAAFPHTAMATSSQQFSRSARMRLLSHH